MKQFVYLYFALHLICISSCTFDNGTLFKINYSPDYSYKRVVQNTSISESFYKGDKELLDYNEKQGLHNPTVIDNSTTTEILFHTKKSDNPESLYWTIEFIKASKNFNDAIHIPNGLKVYGWGTKDKFLNVDSISLRGEESNYAEVIYNSFPDFTFPNEKLKLNDEFHKETPLIIPVADQNVEIIIKTTYKLSKIENDVATFDINQKIFTGPDNKNKSANVYGDGNGTILFDMKNNYYTLYEMKDTELRIQLSLDNYSVDTKTTGALTVITERIKMN